jgi:hypothetical protein
MARRAGRWTSEPDGKLDISRVLSGLGGNEYGNVVFETKKRRTKISFWCVS